uniref:Lycopaoctaene synthase n=1 Tax=Botryococcus braunii TaxID=38881 RepID=LOS_BOTBR|nr:RecName: Full=Lycopaoctaene synthase; AltName: Full=Squalene synthase-like LOS [Botryococcus braunii]AMV49169.1 lycopaoctaene synthase [Botryococcus braunii]
MKYTDFLAHPDEIIPTIRMMYADYRLKNMEIKDPSVRFCYNMLNRVSRSFAMVIQQLPVELRDATCVFYLILRALDTVEDDMAIPKEVKIPMLRTFHEHLSDRSWKIKCGYGPYVDLMDNYPLVTDVYLRFDEGTKAVIKDITRRMGNGMADFIDLDEVLTIPQYDLYCHYVAGLCGIGMCKLFVDSGLEKEDLVAEEDLANQMGLFLQKNNIVRDYLEDINELPAPRMFWPKEIWGNYAKQLDEFKDPKNLDKAMLCLNHMVTDALRHCEVGLRSLSLLHNPNILRAVLIPQVMGVRTLTLVYNNPEVFRGVVKMRRGETAKIFVTTTSKLSFFRTYLQFANEMEQKCLTEAKNDPMVALTLKRVQGVQAACRAAIVKAEIAEGAKGPSTAMVLAGALLIAALAYFAYVYSAGGTSLKALPLFGVVIILAIGLFGRNLALKTV